MSSITLVRSASSGLRPLCSGASARAHDTGEFTMTIAWGTGVPSVSAFLSFVAFLAMKLLAAVAAHATAPSLSAPQRRVLEQYFVALEQSEWAGLGALCTDDVEYHLPGDDPMLSRTVSGRGAFVAFAEETFRVFREPRFELQELISLPTGALARYQASWDAGGQRASAPGAVVFELRGEAIARIGIRVDVQAIGRVAAAS